MDVEYQQSHDAIKSMDEDATATVAALVQRITDMEGTSPPAAPAPLDPSGILQTAGVGPVVATVLALLAVAQ